MAHIRALAITALCYLRHSQEDSFDSSSLTLFPAYFSRTLASWNTPRTYSQQQPSQTSLSALQPS